MKTIYYILIGIIGLILIFSGILAWQQYSNYSAEVSGTAREEAAGKVVWQKLQDKEISCTNLNDGDFQVLGEYYMGQMMGSSHPSMNQLLKQRLGEVGENQMHIAMGKRLSGCDISATYPQGIGPMEMMRGCSF